MDGLLARRTLYKDLDMLQKIVIILNKITQRFYKESRYEYGRECQE